MKLVRGDQTDQWLLTAQSSDVQYPRQSARRKEVSSCRVIELTSRVGAPVQHLYTFETKEEAEEALVKLFGPKQLVSDRDGTEVIYKLFGELTWRNLYALSLHNLPELKSILSQRDSGGVYDMNRHREIIAALENISRVLGLTLPAHWR